MSHHFPDESIAEHSGENRRSESEMVEYEYPSEPSNVTAWMLILPGWFSAFWFGYWTCFIFLIDLGENDFGGLVYMCFEMFLFIITVALITGIFVYGGSHASTNARFSRFVVRSGAACFLFAALGASITWMRWLAV